MGQSLKELLQGLERLSHAGVIFRVEYTISTLFLLVVQFLNLD